MQNVQYNEMNEQCKGMQYHYKQQSQVHHDALQSRALQWTELQ